MPDKSNMLLNAEPAFPSQYQADASSVPRAKMHAFTRAHSLEIPEPDLLEAPAEGDDWDADFQTTDELLDICVAEECATWLAGALHEPVSSEAPKAAESTSDSVVGKPKRTRISPKQRIEKLRKEIQELTTQLQELSSYDKVGKGNGTTLRSQLWQKIAQRQLERRQEAEKTNTELREMMELQVQEAKNLKRVLKRRTRIEMMANMLGMKRLKSEEPCSDPISNNSDKFEQMQSNVNDIYARVDALFTRINMHDIPCPGKRRHAHTYTLNGVFFELAQRTIVPFSAAKTNEAIWNALGQPELQDLRCIHEFRPVQLCSASPGEDKATSMLSFFAANSKESYILGIKVRRIVRKYIEEDRTIFIYRAVMEPKLSEPAGYAGTHATLTLVVEVRQDGVKALGEDATLIQSHFTVVRYDDCLPESRGMRLPKSLGMAIQVLEESVTRIYDHMEGFLVDDACSKKH